MSEPVAVRILDREYLIACKPEERAGLVAANQIATATTRPLRTPHMAPPLSHTVL